MTEAKSKQDPFTEIHSCSVELFGLDHNFVTTIQLNILRNSERGKLKSEDPSAYVKQAYVKVRKYG